jgi:hypothetical protein
MVSNIFAQKIKVKKGEIFLDAKKVGTVEKIKVKGANNYVKLSNLNGEALFESKLMNEKSRYFGKKKRLKYFMINCLTQKDTIGVEKLGFYAGEKRLVKYLVKNKMFGIDGINEENVKKMLAKTSSKPSFVLEKIKNEDELIKNIDFKVDRDLKDKLLVYRKDTRNRSGILSDIPTNSTKYEIYQGLDKDNKVLIGYAIVEVENNRSLLVILNSKNAPIAMFDNFRYYSFYPLEEFKITKLSSKMIKLDKPVGAINQLSNYLIQSGKL